MHAVIAILAALVRRNATGEGAYLDVSVADGVLALMALQIDEYLATGEEPGPGPRHAHRSLRLLRHLRARPTAGGWRSPPSSRASGPTSAAPSGSSGGPTHQTDDAVQDEIRADLRAAFATARPRRRGWPSSAPADTCVAPVLSVAELVDDPQFDARGAFVDAVHPDHGAFRQVAPTLAGTARPDGPYAVPDADVTDTDELLARRRAVARGVRRAARAGVVA